MFGLGLPELIIIGIIIGINGIFVLPFWWIFSKAGFSGWLCLTQFVPILNVGVLFYVAFSEWPVHREINKLRKNIENRTV